MFVINIIKTITRVGVKMKTENKNISTFNSFYLAEPNKSVTHTHRSETNIKVRATRAQYTIKSLINKGCARSFFRASCTPFLRALFRAPKRTKRRETHVDFKLSNAIIFF